MNSSYADRIRIHLHHTLGKFDCQTKGTGSILGCRRNRQKSNRMLGKTLS